MTLLALQDTATHPNSLVMDAGVKMCHSEQEICILYVATPFLEGLDCFALCKTVCHDAELF